MKLIYSQVVQKEVNIPEELKDSFFKMLENKDLTLDEIICELIDLDDSIEILSFDTDKIITFRIE